MFQHRASESETRVWSIVKRTAKGFRGCRPRLQLEELEQRTLLSVVPAGSEFRVNTYTTNTQSNPAVASDAAGDYVVAWQSYQDGSGYGVYAQRYSAAGAAQGTELRVNTYTTSGQFAPKVAADAAGDFVVAWTSNGQDGSDNGIYAQRYNAAGAAQGGEFRVNTYTSSSQSYPAVAMDSTGDFVVAWFSDNSQDGSFYGVYAQRYNAAGVVQGSEFQVNSYITSGQSLPSVAMDSAGDFVIAWQSDGQDGSGFGVYAQHYNAGGVAQGTEFRVNTYTTGYQRSPSVAMDSAGDFVIAWYSPQDGNNGYGVYAQRYSAAGAAQGSEFRVNTYTTSDQLNPTVAMDSAGDFVVAWESFQDGSGFGVYAQRYNAGGVTQGTEFRVNTYTTNFQRFPSVAMDSAGDFVVAWHSYLQDGSGQGVYAQRYAVTPSSVVGRDLFYANSSRYDLPGGSNPQTPNPFSDDNAIATDKAAYLPGSGAATFASVSSYDRGINGIMVDLDNTGSHNSITLAGILNDFTFKVGNNNSPSLWANAPLPVSVLVRTGAGVAGSDRVELVWADGAITEKWIEVTIKATANTGLAANDVFFFGNEIGATGASNTATIAKVGSPDVTDTQTHGATLKANIPVTNIYDFNKDGQVGSADVTDAQTHGTSNKTGLNFINIGAGGPFAPEVVANAAAATSNDSGIAAALASTSSGLTPIAIPTWIVDRLSRLDLTSGLIARYLDHLATVNTPRAREILVAADHVAQPLGLDDTLLDSLLVKLGLDS